MHLWYMALKNNTVLSPGRTEQMVNRYIAEQADGRSHYGYGWALYTSDRETKIISHNGGNGAFFYELIWLPEEDAVIIFSTNASSPQVQRGWAIEKMLFDPSFEPEPIIMNVYQFIVEFIERNPTTRMPKLEETLRSHYEAEISNPMTLNRMGYMALRMTDDKGWAVELFEFNARLFPEEPNTWDSLGDGYRAIGQTQEAIGAYRKGAELGSQASEEKLEELSGSIL